MTYIQLASGFKTAPELEKKLLFALIYVASNVMCQDYHYGNADDYEQLLHNDHFSDLFNSC